MDDQGGFTSGPPIKKGREVGAMAAVGEVLLFFGYVSLFYVPVFLEGSTAGRLPASGATLWWVGRLVVLPWLRAWPEVTETWRRVGFALLHAQRALYALAYEWLDFGRHLAPKFFSRIRRRRRRPLPAS